MRVLIPLENISQKAEIEQMEVLNVFESEKKSSMTASQLPT